MANASPLTPGSSARIARHSPPFLPVAAGLVMVVLLVLPSLILLGRTLNPKFLPALLNPATLAALRLSLITTGITMALILLLATPVAFLLARYRFPGHRLLDVLLDLPIVLPPVVAGVALLLVFGRRGILGGWLNETFGLGISFTSVAVILAQFFVAAPFFIRAMKAGFSLGSERLEAVSLTLGRTSWETFWRVTWPLSLPNLIEGSVLAWARALGEFGATIVFAGSLAGRTRTMPLAIYAALESDLDAALVLSGCLALLAFVLLFVFRVLVQPAKVQR